MSTPKHRRKVGIASTDWSRSYVGKEGPIPGGANYIRLQQNRKHLRYKTVTGLLIHHPKRGFGIRDWFNVNHYDCDVLIIQRVMFRQLAELIEQGEHKQVLINDLDDWYWGLHKKNHAYEATHPDVNPDENIDHYKRIINACDAVVVSTPFLENKMHQEFSCGTVYRIDNCVDVDTFTPRNHSTKKAILGWVGSTSHRSGDIEIVAPALRKVKNRIHHSGHVNGAESFGSRVNVNDRRITTGPMRAPIDYARNSFRFDVGIAPLNDVPFNEAKSWIKCIEYAAANIPFIATDISEYRRLLETHGIGRLATTVSDWVQNIEELNDATLRRIEAKRQKEIVADNLHVTKMAKEWNAIIDRYM